MGYPRCYEVDRDIREERRDAYGYRYSSYDNNYHYNHMIVSAARYNARKNKEEVTMDNMYKHVILKKVW